MRLVVKKKAPSLLYQDRYWPFGYFIVGAARCPGIAILLLGPSLILLSLCTSNLGSGFLGRGSKSSFLGSDESEIIQSIVPSVPSYFLTFSAFA
jgi:hypothetical protein